MFLNQLPAQFPGIQKKRMLLTSTSIYIYLPVLHRFVTPLILPSLAINSENRYTFGKLIFLVNAVIILVRYIFHISIMEPG